MDKPSLPACHRVIQGTDPKAPKVIAHVNLAADYFKRRLYDEAIQEYSIAIRLEPDSSAKGLFFGLRAHAMEHSGRIDAAIADLDDASRLNQNQAFSYLDRRDALLEKQRAKRQALDGRKAAVPERAQKAVEARDQEKQLREQPSQQEAAQIAASDRERAERAERARIELQQEERRQAEVRAFSSQRETCRGYDIAACQAALSSPHAVGRDASELKQRLGVVLRFQELVRACSSGTASACNEALASPALKTNQRPEIERWREVASIYYRASASMAGAARTVTAFSVETAKAVGNLWTSTRVAGGIAAILALALVAIAYRARGRGADLMRTSEALGRVAAVAGCQAKRASQFVALAARFFWRSAISTLSPARKRMQATYTMARDWLLRPRPYTAKPSAHAQRHLRNALIYFDKWEHAKYWPDRRDLCRFAAQQIEQAKKYDIKAALSFIDQDGRPDTWTLKQFSAAALFYEAQSHMNDRRYRTAIRAFWRALKLAPDTTQYQNALAEAYIKLGRSKRAGYVLRNIKYPNFRTTELQAATLKSPLVGIPAYPTLPFPNRG